MKKPAGLASLGYQYARRPILAEDFSRLRRTNERRTRKPGPHRTRRTLQ